MLGCWFRGLFVLEGKIVNGELKGLRLEDLDIDLNELGQSVFDIVYIFGGKLIMLREFAKNNVIIIVDFI